jgi:ComF family protein
MRLDLRSWVNILGQFFFPPVCRFCDRTDAVDANNICETCWASLEPVTADSDHGILHRAHLDDVRCAFQYNSFLRDVIHALKYDRLTATVTRLADRIADGWPTTPGWTHASWIVPIPLHRVRRRERGYNQVQLIAQYVSKRIGCPVAPDLVIRRKNNVSQTAMATVDERRLNVADIFQFNNAYSIEGKTLVILDDVITTGATIDACAAVLKEHGAARVLGFGVGRPVFEA